MTTPTNLKARELRIGNWVHSKTHKANYQVILIDRDNDYSHIDGIPLTEDILVKCPDLQYDPLEERFSFYGTNQCEYILEQQEDWFFIGVKHSDSINYFVWDIKYLHQFQNLYFALTGEELKIEL